MATTFASPATESMLRMAAAMIEADRAVLRFVAALEPPNPRALRRYRRFERARLRRMIPAHHR